MKRARSTSVHFDPVLLEVVDREAARDHRSRSNTVGELVRLGLAVRGVKLADDEAETPRAV